MQVSWIDPEEIAKLAAQLEGPLQREEPASWNLDTLPNFSDEIPLDEKTGADFSHLADAMSAPPPDAMETQGAATPPEVSHIREKLRAIRDRAREAGLLPSANTAAEISNHSPPAQAIEPPPSPNSHLPSANAFLPLEGTLTERLQSFMQWAQILAQCQDIILIDDHGELLWGDARHAPLALPALLAAGAGLRSGAEAVTQTPVFIRARLEGEKELSILPCSTRHGMVTLALLNAPDLPTETAACLREALKLSIEGKEPG